jgi:Tol biopolymer transport system component
VTVRSAILVVVVVLGLGAVAASCDSVDEKARKPAGPCLIAFRFKDADYGDSPSDIYVANPDGSGRRNLTGQADVFEWGPVWSPDGRKIAFTAPTWSPGGTRILFSRDFGIWMINRDGTGLRPVARPRGAPVYESPSWSPSCR